MNFTSRSCRACSCRFTWRIASRSSTSWRRRRRSRPTASGRLFLPGTTSELTLETVTEEERDYMYRAYAHDPARCASTSASCRRLRAAARQRPAEDGAAGRHPAVDCPVRPSSTTATRSGWGTTSTSATATAFARPCSGASTGTPASRGRTRSGSSCRSRSTPSTTTRPSTSMPNRTTRARRLWWTKRLVALRKQFLAFGRGNDRVPDALESPRAGLRAPARRRSRSSSSRTCLASRDASSSTFRSGEACTPSSSWGRRSCRPWATRPTC